MLWLEIVRGTLDPVDLPRQKNFSGELFNIGHETFL
jgi:hypothetical protein